MMTTAADRWCCVGSALLVSAVCFTPDRLDARPIVEEKPVQVIRPEARTLDRALELGLAQSPTLRSLTGRLEALRTIVYLGSTMPFGSQMFGRTRLIAAAGGFRFLRIDVDLRLSRIDLISIIAHELQHALEIAEDPSVVDEDSMIALYQRIGSAPAPVAPGEPRRFETDAAIETGRRVHAELVRRPG